MYRTGSRWNHCSREIKRLSNISLRQVLVGWPSCTWQVLFGRCFIDIWAAASNAHLSSTINKISLSEIVLPMWEQDKVFKIGSIHIFPYYLWYPRSPKISEVSQAAAWQARFKPWNLCQRIISLLEKLRTSMEQMWFQQRVW